MGKHCEMDGRLVVVFVADNDTSIRDDKSPESHDRYYQRPQSTDHHHDVLQQKDHKIDQNWHLTAGRIL